MGGLWVVFWKELNDNFSSRRFLIMFFIICFVAIASSYLSAQNLSTILEQYPTEFVFLRSFCYACGKFSLFCFFFVCFLPLC